jgi:hypothetical protein
MFISPQPFLWLINQTLYPSMKNKRWENCGLKKAGELLVKAM